MSENNNIVQANVREHRSGWLVSKVWILPIVAAALGLWLVAYQWYNQGPKVTIQFNSASGIEVGKTPIKTRDVEIGLVEDLRLNNESDAVLVEARIDKNHAHLLRTDSAFWMVRPRIGPNGISGLGTLLSGGYIELAPGNSRDTQRTFTGLESPPVTPAGAPGLHVTLNSDDRFAYSSGDPIIYKGLSVGRIEDIDFNLEERVVYYNAFIRSPYHELLTDTTRFWDASGIQMDLTAEGLSIKTGNFETLVTNGIEFGVPEGYPNGEQISERAFYDIFANYEQAAAARFKREAKFVIMVADSVRGLHVGAPVEYRGIKVGRVIEILPDEATPKNILNEGYEIPVVISVQPGRVGQPDNDVGVAFVKEQTLRWVETGFRATLKTGNLLTGAQFVELEFHDETQVNTVAELRREHLGYDVIPMGSNEITQFGQKVSTAVDSINAMELELIADNVNTMMSEISGAAQQLQSLSGQLSTALSDPKTQRLLTSLDSGINQLNVLMTDYAGGSENYREINSTLRSLDSTIRDLRPLLHELNGKPNSLVFTGAAGEDKQPKAAGK
jgi:paraquat-inducible protein B